MLEIQLSKAKVQGAERFRVCVGDEEMHPNVSAQEG